jgi:hypothetical protein
MSEPLPWALDWPWCQDIGTRYLGMSPTPKATLSPIFRFLTQIGSKRVSFHIPKHAKQVVVLFNRKRLEAALVQMTGTLGVMVGMPSHRMCVRQPAKEPRHLILVLGTYHEVPMIGHHTVSKDRQLFSFECFDQNAVKRFVVLRFLEQGEPSDGPVEDVKATSRGTNSRTAWHR